MTGVRCMGVNRGREGGCQLESAQSGVEIFWVALGENVPYGVLKDKRPCRHQQTAFHGQGTEVPAQGG